jgi:type VI protein secretion system component VasK
VDKKHDFLSTTQVLIARAPGLAWLPRVLRQRLTPAALWGAIVGMVGMLVLAVTAWVSTQKNIAHLQELSARAEAHEQKTDELLQQLVTGQAVTNGKIDGMTDEMDRQRRWREGIEREAESPPHARRGH